MIPAALAPLRRWSPFYVVERDGRIQKIARLKTNEPDTWLTYDEAVARAAASRDRGVGFLLGDGWAGIDIDAVPFAPEATRRIIDAVGDAYVEVTLSVCGLHVVGRADRLGCEIDFRPGRTNTPWTGARFFAFTGLGLGDPTVDITAALDAFAPVPKEAPRGPFEGFESASMYPDEELMYRILESAQAEKFRALFRGDVSAYGGDHSRADQALASLLAFWTNGDLDRVDRIFRQSALYRPKWEQTSYRNATLRKAVSR